MLDFNAGKYAAFVWPAYALSVAVIGAMIADTLSRARRWRRAAEAREADARERAAPLAQPPLTQPPLTQAPPNQAPKAPAPELPTVET